MSERIAADAGSTTSKHRVQCDFAKPSMDRLKKLREKTEASTFSEVIRNALQIYEALVDDTEAGRTFMVREPDGTVSACRLWRGA